MKLDELMQQLVNLSHEERVTQGRSCAADIKEDFEKIGIGEKYADFMVFIIKLFVSADRNCSKDEYKLINDIYELNMSYDDFFEMTNHGANSDFVKDLDALIDSLPEDTKIKVCLFGLFILASDDTISAEEQKLFQRILE